MSKLPGSGTIVNGIPIRELLIRLREGDRAAFGTLYEGFFDSLWRLAILVVHAPEPAEEIVQEVFLDLWVRRESIDVATDIRVYLNEAVRHRAYNVLRHQRVVFDTEDAVEHETLEPPAVSQPFVAPDGAAETEEFYAAYHRVLATLTRRDVVALRLRWEEGFTFDQIGKILGVSAVGARKIVLRGQLKVQEALAKYRGL